MVAAPDQGVHSSKGVEETTDGNNVCTVQNDLSSDIRAFL